MPDPPYFAAYYFAETLINNGIIFINMMDPVQIAGKLDKPVSYDSSKMITSLFSPPLKDIVYIINKRSNNLYTEQVLKALAFYKKNEGSTDKGIETLYDFLKQSNVPTGGVYFHDGCGLSRFNGITAKSLAKLLSFNTKQSYFRSFYYSMGIAGDPDDISFFKNYGKNTIIAKNARIKDGLIGHVRSHSGYVTSRSGRLISFSFIANNYEGSARTINEMHTELIIKLAELL
ncbi:MAG: D-alanyl-D-alanine carboxypeptidase [Bacillota bacterium]